MLGLKNILDLASVGRHQLRLVFVCFNWCCFSNGIILKVCRLLYNCSHWGLRSSFLNLLFNVFERFISYPEYVSFCRVNVWFNWSLRGKHVGPRIRVTYSLHISILPVFLLWFRFIDAEVVELVVYHFFWGFFFWSLIAHYCVWTIVFSALASRLFDGQTCSSFELNAAVHALPNWRGVETYLAYCWNGLFWLLF